MTDGQGPDFVCIGAQKAGTTWLYENLLVHPQVWLPPVKEIHFFNLLCAPEELLGIEVDQHPRGIARYRPLLRRPSWSRLRWFYRFYHMPRSSNWYQALFDAAPPGCLGGDITPAYSILDERGVAFAHRLLKPSCRVILILRNPIERIWSGIKMVYRWRGDDIHDVNMDEIQRNIESPSNRLRSDYPVIIDRWSRLFGERLGIFLYDDLVADPATFLHSVEHFLGIDESIDRAWLRKMSNADSAKVAMPEGLHQLLTDRYRHDIEMLERWVPGICQRWSM